MAKSNKKNNFSDLKDLVQKAPMQTKSKKGSVKIAEKQVLIKMPIDLHKKLKMISIQRETTLKELINEAVRSTYIDI